MTKVKEQPDGIAKLLLPKLCFFVFFAVDVAHLWITLFSGAPFLCPNFSNIRSAPAVFLDQGYEGGPWALYKCLTLISCMGQQDGNI